MTFAQRKGKEAAQDSSDTALKAKVSDWEARFSRVFEEGASSRPSGYTQGLHSGDVMPGGHHVTYKEALLKPRTFKPRFPAAPQQQLGWLTEKKRQKPMPSSSVWSRLGARPSIHDRLGAKVVPVHDRLGPRMPGSGWLELLRTKAGSKCFNCLAAGHRIADCRDPPRCILCSRFGHKARSCPSEANRCCSAAAHHIDAAPPPLITVTAAATSPPRATTTAAPPRAATAPAPIQPASSCFAAPAGVGEPTMDEDGYAWSHRIPGAPAQRPEHVSAAVARSDDVRESERSRELLSLIAVQLDVVARIETNMVMAEAVGQLGLPYHDLGVERLAPSFFLLHFNTQQQRCDALRRGSLRVVHTELHFLPWTRHNFLWQLGVPDGTERHRITFQERLGVPRRDRSPPRGDRRVEQNRQIHPSARPHGRAGPPTGAFRFHRWGESWRWQPTGSVKTTVSLASSASLARPVQVATEPDFLFGERCADTKGMQDPMREEALLGDTSGPLYCVQDSNMVEVESMGEPVMDMLQKQSGLPDLPCPLLHSGIGLSPMKMMTSPNENKLQHNDLGHLVTTEHLRHLAGESVDHASGSLHSKDHSAVVYQSDDFLQTEVTPEVVQDEQTRQVMNMASEMLGQDNEGFDSGVDHGPVGMHLTQANTEDAGLIEVGLKTVTANTSMLEEERPIQRAQPGLMLLGRRE